MTELGNSRQTLSPRTIKVPAITSIKDNHRARAPPKLALNREPGLREAVPMCFVELPEARFLAALGGGLELARKVLR